MTPIDKYAREEITLEDAIKACALIRAADRRAKGVVYTPAHVVNVMIEKSRMSRDDEVWEPSCGHGAFVFPMLDAARRFCGSWGEVRDWFAGHVLCTDLCPDTIGDLRNLLSVFFTQRGVHTEAETFTNVQAMNALRPAFARRFTLCIGNPPYVRTREMDPDELRDLRKRFASMAKGNVDLYYAFIERALSLCDRATLIVPNACLSAAGAATLRTQCFPRLREICDFGVQLPFEDARAYVAVLRFERDIGETLTLRSGFSAQSTQVRWADLSGDAFRRAPKLAMSGIATLADSAFIVTQRDGRFISDATGEEIEPAIVRPLVKITKRTEIKHILFPYAGRRPLSEAFLQTAYPAAYRHLCAVRDRLDARDKGKVEGYTAWYAYGRSQGLHDLVGEASLIMIPTMIGGASVPFLYEGPAPLFVSGFAVKTADDPECTLLTPAFREFVMAHGSEKPGGEHRYFAITVGIVNAWLMAQYP